MRSARRGKRAGSGWLPVLGFAVAAVGLLAASGARAGEGRRQTVPSREAVRARFRRVHREAERLGVRLVTLRGLLRAAPHRPGQPACLERALTGTLALQRRIAWFLHAERPDRPQRPGPALQALRARVAERTLRQLRRQVRACLAPETRGRGTVVRVEARPPLGGPQVGRWQTPPAPPARHLALRLPER